MRMRVRMIMIGLDEDDRLGGGGHIRIGMRCWDEDGRLE